MKKYRKKIAHFGRDRLTYCYQKEIFKFNF